MFGVQYAPETRNFPKVLSSGLMDIIFKEDVFSTVHKIPDSTVIRGKKESGHNYGHER